LKLENLMCVDRESNLIRVCDFGIAGGTTIDSDSLNAGSICYMPPEVLLGNIKRLEPSIDVWAMGVILFVMLAGRLPFSG
jgi:serine/threonine protein kinase